MNFESPRETADRIRSEILSQYAKDQARIANEELRIKISARNIEASRQTLRWPPVLAGAAAFFVLIYVLDS